MFYEYVCLNQNVFPRVAIQLALDVIRVKKRRPDSTVNENFHQAKWPHLLTTDVLLR